jgi:lipopolysaccharide export LptBFGC system permease protein LptF
MFDILDRFLLKDFLIYFVAILIGLASLYLGVDFLSKFWGMNLPVSKVLEIYGYKLPAVIQQFIPVACLMATLLVISNMSRQNEVLALYSMGIGPFRLASTFIAATAVISALAFMLFDSLVSLHLCQSLLSCLLYDT